MYGGNVILSKYQNTKTYDRRPKTYNNMISSSVKDVETFNLYNSLHVHHEIF